MRKPCIGPFVLAGQLGEGTYGEVWEGRHARSEFRVAIKFLPWREASDVLLRRTLEREARLLAGLEHPHVVRMLDFGEVTAAESRSTGGRWPRGTPYLVLEYMGGGSCTEVRGRLAWVDLRDVLFRVLDALAHAHARGVIHLDLKPGNILLGGAVVAQRPLGTRDDARGLVAGLRLADFGIAGIFGKASRRQSSIGTPAYMAPEQFRRAWRDFGPWTDLYSLGCTAWAMVTGFPPFVGKKGRDLVLAHAYAELPLFQPRMGVPEGLEAWLGSLLEKDPTRRPSRCAEASQALASLGDAEDLQADSLPIEPEDPTLLFSEEATVLLSEWAGEVSAIDLEAYPTATLASENLGVIRTWRRSEPPPTPLILADAGLGLIGRRVSPMVGRDRERDQLWQALLRVRESRQAQLVALRGLGGHGLSRLAHWVCHRSHELGIADPIVVTHSAEESGTLNDALRDWLRGWNLDRTALELRIGRLLRLWGSDQTWLAGLVAGLVVEGHTAARPRDVEGVLLALLSAAGSRRTLVLVIDDAQWASTSLGLVRALLGAERARVLVVLTIREDVDPLPRAQEALTSLLRHARSEVLEVPPLPEQDIRRLLEDVLRLEPLLSARVVGLAGGSPQFAQQVVSGWAQRGELIPTPEGFVLRDPDHTRLPEDLTSLLLERLEPLENGDPVPLEVAAALGARVYEEEWLALCPGVEGLARRATEAGLLQPIRDGWRFQEGVVREILAERSRRGGRWAGHHGRCARLLADRPEKRMRLGRHLLESGMVEQAFERLTEAVQQARNAQRSQEAMELADLASKALGMLSPAPDDERLGLQLQLECRLLRDIGDQETLKHRASRQLALARKHGWRTLEGEGLIALARALQDERDLRCEDLLREALVLFLAEGDAWRACRVQCHQANLYSVLGRIGLAEESADLAVEGSGQLGDREGLALALLARSLVRERQSRWKEALEDGREALAITLEEGVPLWVINARGSVARILRQLQRPEEALGEQMVVVESLRQQINLSALASNLNTLGDLERRCGRAESAEAHYREVVEMGRLAGHARHFARLNLGLLLLEEERPAEVRGLVEPVREHAKTIGHLFMETCSCAVLCWAMASLGDAAALQSLLDRFEELFAVLEAPDLDLAVSLERAGEEACQRLSPETASRVLLLAGRIYSIRGDISASEGCRLRAEELN